MTLGLLLAMVGGTINGSFAAPMKRMAGWKWEHSWFVWAFSGLILVPCVTALLTIPNLGGVYSASSWGSIGMTMLFGFLWGISALLFGMGIDRLGLALGYGIILGISSALGAIGPLVAKHSDQVFTRTGLLTIVGVALVVAGVAGCAVAGRIRERAEGAERRGALMVGLLICVASGIATPMMNFGLAYGSEIADHARRLGAGDSHVVNAQWPILLLAGFLANAGYCGWLMSARSGWRPLVEAAPAKNISLGLLMGLLWMGGLLMYGYASRMLGPLGLVLGWPITMACSVLAANAWGAATGEWTGAPRSAKIWIAIGVAVLIAGVCVISYASDPSV